MDVSRIRALRGPNLWSRHTAIQAIVRCDGAETAIADLPGFEARLRERFPKLQNPPSDDICYATQNRQLAVKQMAKDCDLMIVVGSRNSSNSVRLVEVALELLKSELGARPIGE